MDYHENFDGGFAPGAHALLDRLAAQLDHQPLPDWMSRFKEHLTYYPEWSEKTKTQT
jgi:hypothetical protein